MSRDFPVSRLPPASVLRAYFPLDRIGQLQWLGNAGGFSGTQFWRFVADDTPWCLRRWPAQHPTIEQLTWIHHVLRHASRRGVDFLPVPRPMADGRTFCREGGYLWELSAWLPGQADFWLQPNDEKLAAALTGLARFHLATQDLKNSTKSPAPGLVERHDQLARWRRAAPQLRLDSTRHPELTVLAGDALQIMPRLYGRCASGLDRAVQISVDLQPCIRDIWHDHALFVGSTLSGMVDFGAMRMDSVVLDVSRLLGSLVEDESRRWQVGLAAYEQIRPLADEERCLLATVDMANVILSAANWIRWLFVEHRTFEDLAQVRRRIERILRRLRTLAETVG